MRNPVHKAWETMTADLGAPRVFLDFALYSAVSIALERRVFYGQLDARPWFVNNYTLLVGPAGVGKGQAMREASRVLNMFSAMDGEEEVLDKNGEPVPLFKSMSDTMTFELLVSALAQERSSFVREDNSVYQHTSAYVILEELSSLLRINKADDVAQLMLVLYDCEDYEYRTKKSGSFTIRSGCFNLLAGTTVDFLQRAAKAGLVEQGLMSRFMLVYADTRQFDRFMQSEMSEEQKTAQRIVGAQLFRLSKIFGPLTISPDTLKFLEDWWEAERAHLASFGDPMLDNIFTRRKAQVMKLAAASHFTEHTSREVGLEAFQKATMMLRENEEPIIRMLRQAGGRNLAYGIGERLISRITRVGRMHHSEVMNFLAQDLDFVQINNLLLTLEQSGRLTKNGLLWTTSKLPSPLATPYTTSSIPPSLTSLGLIPPPVSSGLIPPPVTPPNPPKAEF